MGWWMNFDNGFVHCCFIGGVAMVIMHFVMAGRKDEVFSDSTHMT